MSLGKVVTDAVAGAATAAIIGCGSSDLSLPPRPAGDDPRPAGTVRPKDSDVVANTDALQPVQNKGASTGIQLEDNPTPKRGFLQRLINSSTLTTNNGLWIREKDQFAQMVLQIREAGDGGMSATLLWRPQAAAQHGWSVGDKKIKDIVRLKDDAAEQYSVASMRKLDGGNHEFEEGTLTVLGDGRLLYKGESQTGSIGDKQYWRPLNQNSSEMAYVWYGQAAAAADREDYATVNKLLNKIATSNTKDVTLLNAVAWITATCAAKEIRNPTLAVTFAERSNELTSEPYYEFLDTLAAAYAAGGQFDKAVTYQEKAIKLRPELAEIREILTEGVGEYVGFKGRLKLYKEQKPFIGKTVEF